MHDRPFDRSAPANVVGVFRISLTGDRVMLSTLILVASLVSQSPAPAAQGQPAASKLATGPTAKEADPKAKARPKAAAGADGAKTEAQNGHAQLVAKKR